MPTTADNIFRLSPNDLAVAPLYNSISGFFVAAGHRRTPFASSSVLKALLANASAGHQRLHMLFPQVKSS
jgi:hypothetical protein